MMLLEYIKLRARSDRNSRVSEAERMLFDTLKIISECSWVIHTADDLLSILEEINFFIALSEQTYYFVWYTFALHGLESEVLDNHLATKYQLDLKFADQRKTLFNIMIGKG